MPVFNLIEYSDNYSKTSGSVWQYYRDEPNDKITESESFKSKIRITGNSPNNGNKENVETAVPLKSLSNFLRILEMSLIDCKIDLILTWSKNCVIPSATAETKFAITNTKRYVITVTLSTEDNEKLLEKLK